MKTFKKTHSANKVIVTRNKKDIKRLKSVLINIKCENSIKIHQPLQLKGAMTIL